MQIIIGDSGVGKSSLLIRFVRNEYHEQTRSTISAAYLTRRVETAGRVVQFEIWDTAGQERFRSLNTPMYYRGAAGAVIVYDISDPTSFKNARGWYTQLMMLGEPGVKVVIVGNKSDLEHKRGVDDAAVEDFSRQNKLVSIAGGAWFSILPHTAITHELSLCLMPFICLRQTQLRTSARSGENVEEVFKDLASRMPLEIEERAPDAVILLPPKQDRSCCS